jgi:hypothetical protein
VDDEYQPLIKPNKYFDEARSFHNGQAIVKTNEQYYRVDNKLNRISGSELNYSFIGEFFNERAVVKKVIKGEKVKYGHIRLSDYTLIGKGLKFLFAGNFRNDVAPVKIQETKEFATAKIQNEKWGFINLEGKVYEKQKAIDIKETQEGYVMEKLTKSGKIAKRIYDKDGQPLMPDDDFYFLPEESFSNGFIVVQEATKKNNGKFGLMNMQGNFLIEQNSPKSKTNFRYESAKPFSKEGFAVVEILNEKGFYYIDRNGNIVSNRYQQAYSFQNGFAVVQMSNPLTFVLINTNFQVVSNQYSLMTDIGDGIVGVQNNLDKGYFFISVFTRNEICAGKRYEDVKIFADGVCVVKKFAENGSRGNWGIIDKNCTEVCDFIYHKAISDKFREGKFKFIEKIKVKGNELEIERCIDLDGKPVLQDSCD